MKKAAFVFLVISVLFVACSTGPNLYGSLTISNSPAGHSFYAFVYNSSVLPNTYSEYSSMTTSSMAVGSGTSPISLAWPSGTTSGNYLVRLTSGSTTKIVIANFNGKGEATVNWGMMIDAPTR